LKEILRVIVGSKNPVKINAAKHVFSLYFPDHIIECKGEHAPSDVPDQPLGKLRNIICAPVTQNQLA